MTKANIYSNRSFMDVNQSALSAELSGSIDSACQRHINSVLKNIESPAVREIVKVVFHDLLRLLECLNLIEIHLRKVESADQSFALFQLIHDDARSLVTFIQTEGLRRDLLSEELFDTLDGITFAVDHDLQRVFETTSTGGNKSQVIVGRLYRAHDVLTNCLQQSTITLAMLFNPELDGPILFNNSDMRFRQSLQLCEDLAQLNQLVESAEVDPVESNLAALTERLERFRSDSMELLMYSDWPQFESFCDRVSHQPNGQERSTVLHQFRCYLETLLGQIRMRAVLANVFPLGFGDDRFSSASPTPTQSFSEGANWSQLALAV